MSIYHTSVIRPPIILCCIFMSFCHLVGALWRAAIVFLLNHFAHAHVSEHSISSASAKVGIKVVHENGLSGHNFIFLLDKRNTYHYEWSSKDMS